MDLATSVQSATPKGDAIGAQHVARGSPTEIVGEPLHNIIGMRRSVGVLKCDTQDFIADYMDGITRLSAETVDLDATVPDAIGDVGLDLLKSAIHDDVASFKRRMEADTAGEAISK